MLDVINLGPHYCPMYQFNLLIGYLVANCRPGKKVIRFGFWSGYVRIIFGLNNSGLTLGFIQVKFRFIEFSSGEVRIRSTLDRARSARFGYRSGRSRFGQVSIISSGQFWIR